MLKVYDVEIVADGPIFIGNGKKIEKKEYTVSWRKNKVYITDQYKLYKLLEEKKLVRSYLDFALGSDKSDLGGWLTEKRVSEESISKCCRYDLDCGDAVVENKSKLEIWEFIKDAYGMPYIPGSSLKGALRTILLAYDIKNNAGRYNSIKNDIMTKRPIKQNDRYYLSGESSKVEEIAFRKIKRVNDKNPNDARNDILSGLIVSDSEPLSVNDLVLCQKVDVKFDGVENRINTLRESLKPGTKIKFSITIDDNLCSIKKEDIENALKNFNNVYYDCFLEKFKMFDRPLNNNMWLGGGAGFVSKTVIYPLLGRKNGVSSAVNIFFANGAPKKHRHYEDVKDNISPHMCKATYYKGKLYQMGLCHINITENSTFAPKQ